MQLDFPAPPRLRNDVIVLVLARARRRRFGPAASTAFDGRYGEKNGQGGSEKEGERDRSRRAGEEMPALRHRQDAAVADGAHGPQDALQRLWGPIQVGPARAGVPARSQPDILADKALELAPEGSGAPTPEGFPQSSTTPTAPPTTATIHSSSSSSERNGV